MQISAVERENCNNVRARKISLENFSWSNGLTISRRRNQTGTTILWFWLWILSGRQLPHPLDKNNGGSGDEIDVGSKIKLSHMRGKVHQALKPQSVFTPMISFTTTLFIFSTMLKAVSADCFSKESKKARPSDKSYV